MDDSYGGMESAVIGNIKWDDIVLLGITAFIAATVSVTLCFWWFRREQRRLQMKILASMANPGNDSDELFLTGIDVATYGELIAQFKVNHGKRVVSLLEAGGKRFIHVDGELSTLERANMVRYLKSEGFMS
jgi:hypothetical protein